MASMQLQYDNFLFSLNYEIVNFSAKNSVLFLHGWGSNKEIMKQAFGKTLSDFKHIYLDMAGFGRSSIPQEALTTEDYKNIVSLFLKNISNEAPLIVVGHSFGGKVGTLLNPKNLILLSSAGIVLKKRFSVKLKIAIFKILKTLGFSFLRNLFISKDAQNMPESMYQTFKNVVDEDFSEKFASFKNKAIIFWGSQDDTTPPAMGKQINGLIKNSTFVPLAGDHYFFLQNSRYIAQK